MCHDDSKLKLHAGMSHKRNAAKGDADIGVPVERERYACKKLVALINRTFVKTEYSILVYA